jgi:threonine 3-dehydrogenase
MEMNAIVKAAPEPGAVWMRMPVPQPKAQEVLVRVKATAVCGTDLHIAAWNTWAQHAGIRPPMIMGHEFCGEIVEVGAQVKGLKPGDVVAGETHIPCGECYQCRNGLQHICARMVLFGVNCNGCFAEYTTIPALCAYPVPPEIPPRVAAMLEPLGTSLRAVVEMGVAGSSVVVIGCGPIGLFAIAAARALGAALVIGLDVVEDRLTLAKRLGCDMALHSRQTDVRQHIVDATGGVGTDVIIEASGNAVALSSAFGYLRKGGRCALIGLPSKPVELNLGPDVVFKEATIVGIHGRHMFATWTRMLSLLSSKRLNVDPVITHELPLASYAEGLSALEHGKGAKVILVP